MKRCYGKLRSVWLLAGAISPALAGLAPVSAKSLLQGSFAAPEGPVTLTRELRRIIAPGVEIVSRRSYELRFIREGEGWRVDGDLIGAQVEAPAELAPLASLEKARKDEGLFPLRLDSRGLIVAQDGASDAPAAAQARAMVGESVGRIAMPAADKAVAGQMVERIAAQSLAVGANWPSDLFRPAAAASTRISDVPLPGGRQGKVTVTLQASPGARGLPEQFERRVLTELDGTRRLSLETWRINLPD